jgi:hypothetical protein
MAQRLPSPGLVVDKYLAVSGICCILGELLDLPLCTGREQPPARRAPLELGRDRADPVELRGGARR